MNCKKIVMVALLAVVAFATANCANQNKKPYGLKTIYFDLDQSYVRNDMVPTMDHNVDVLKKGRHRHFSTQAVYGKGSGSSGKSVNVEGHCDERGSNEYNMALGNRRAEATKSYLVSHGVSPSRLKTVSYGEEKPACNESNESCWWKNRRAQFSK